MDFCRPGKRLLAEGLILPNNELYITLRHVPSCYKMNATFLCLRFVPPVIYAPLGPDHLYFAKANTVLICRSFGTPCRIPYYCSDTRFSPFQFRGRVVFLAPQESCSGGTSPRRRGPMRHSVAHFLPCGSPLELLSSSYFKSHMCAGLQAWTKQRRRRSRRRNPGLHA
jgi:hypothetical protein